MSDDLLLRKIQLTQDYISVYSKVDPSPYTKWRGRLTEELVGPTIMLAKRKKDKNEVGNRSIGFEISDSHF